MLKEALRKKYKQKRKTLSSDEVFFLSEQIFKQFLNYFKPYSCSKVHIFIPIQKFNEINTSFFLDYFFKNNIRVFVPKIIDEKLISIEVFKNTNYIENSWGISEPESNIDSKIVDFDFVITPLLYCDSYGNRVGYGKGFYDALFKAVSTKTKKIGINYFNPDEMIDDVWENDIPLDYLVTPYFVFSFDNEGKG